MPAAAHRGGAAAGTLARCRRGVRSESGGDVHPAGRGIFRTHRAMAPGGNGAGWW